MCSCLHASLVRGLAAQEPNVQCWGSEAEDSGDPPRLWAPHALYPGTAFTRSIGDSGAASRRPGRRIFGCRPIFTRKCSL